MTTDTLQLTQEKSITFVTFVATCLSDVDAIGQATDQLTTFIDTIHPAKMIFDFSGVKFFSSQVLGVLIETRAKISSYQGQLALCCIAPQLKRVFSITNLDQIFNLAENRIDAMSILNS
ncbi:MAG: STAS domain-containing protein [Phycisphaerae bacterium]|nr:STAS domain-containing protein [Phycisphaerae bacterium]